MSLSERERWMISASVWAIVFFLVSSSVVLPKLKKFKATKVSMMELEQRLGEHQAELSRLDALEKKQEAKEAELVSLRSEKKAEELAREKLQSVSMVDFLKTWASAAQNQEIKIEYVKPVSGGGKSLGQNLQAEVSLKGKYVSLRRFFSWLDEQQKVPPVRKFTLSPAEDGYPYLSAVFEVELRLRAWSG